MYQVYVITCQSACERLVLITRFPRRLQKREKLPMYNTIDDAVDLIRKSRNIMILTGAGISKHPQFLICSAY